MARILFLEDDQDYQDIVSSVLENAGYSVENAKTVNEAYQKVKSMSFDLVISDLKLEGLNGFQFVELIREINPTIRVLILTSSGAPGDEIQGLELGVNDYLNKSVSFMVLIKRIEWLLKQGVVATEPETILRSKKEDLELNKSERMLFMNGEGIKLSYFEFEILAYFLSHKNLAVQRNDIIKAIWGTDTSTEYVDERNVDTHIKNIRAKTGTRSIHSIRSVGYKWIE